MTINWVRLKPAKTKEGEQITNPVLDEFEAKCMELRKTWSVKPVKAAETGSQDDPDLGGQGLRQSRSSADIVTGAAPASVTGITIGPSLVQVGTGVVTGTDNGLDRALSDTNKKSLGGQELNQTHDATGATLELDTCIATGPGLEQAGTGVVTGTDTGLEWVLDEDDVEDTYTCRRRRRAVRVKANY